MGRRLFKYITVLSLIFITFIINTNSVKAYTLNCEYEAYPLNFYIDNNIYKFLDTSLAKLTYKTNGEKDYKISIDKNNNNKVVDFEDNKFNKSHYSSQTCPSYIKYNTNNTITEITISDFNSELVTYLKKHEGIFFLTRQNGVLVEDYAYKALNIIIPKYNVLLGNAKSDIIHQCEIGEDQFYKYVNYNNYGYTPNEFLTYVSGNYSSTTKNQIDYNNNISETCWNARKSYVLAAYYARDALNKISTESDLKSLIDDEDTSKVRELKTLYNYIDKYEKTEEKMKEDATKTEQRANKQEQVNTYKNNYCALYCQEIMCNYSNSTAVDNCMKSCNSTSNVCTKAYNNCKNVPGSDFDSCMRGQFKEYDTYNQKRNQIITELENDISRLDEELKHSATTPPVQRRTFRVNAANYELKCEDVSILHTVWLILWIIGPVLLILMLTIDYTRAVIASDVEKMKKVKSKAPKRVIAAILLALTPAFVTLIVNLVSGIQTAGSSVSNTNIMQCIVNGGE